MEKRKRGNIKNMLLTMPGKKGGASGAAKGGEKDVKLEGDDVLASLLGK